MAIKEREYLFSVDKFNKPVVREQYTAITLLLMRLILLEPGSDPLHPEMGVGIKNYRFAMDKTEELRERIQNQIDTYLPCFPSADVAIVQTTDRLCNIEITINDTIYVYDSSDPNIPIPISLDTLRE